MLNIDVTLRQSELEFIQLFLEQLLMPCIVLGSVVITAKKINWDPDLEPQYTTCKK